MITFRVHGVAQSKGNLKAYTPRGMKFPIVTERNRSVRSWSQLVAEAASRRLNEIDHGLILGAVRVRVDFALPRPKALGHKAAPHLKKPDLDKLSRAVLDALTGVLYHDDGQVVELLATKTYAPVTMSPYCDVRVEAALDGHALPLVQS